MATATRKDGGVQVAQQLGQRVPPESITQDPAFQPRVNPQATPQPPPAETYTPVPDATRQPGSAQPPPDNAAVSGPEKVGDWFGSQVEQARQDQAAGNQGQLGENYVAGPMQQFEMPEIGNVPYADPSQFTGAAQAGMSAIGGAGSVDYDPALRAKLVERINGQGIGPTFQEVVDNVYTPQAQEFDRIFTQAQDQAVEEMISRGILDSAEAVGTMRNLAGQLANKKASLLGELGLRHQEMLNESINAALQTMGVLEGNKMSANASILSSKISAMAQLQSAAMSAGATVAAANISVAGRLIQAQGDWNVAFQRFQAEQDWDLTQQGIDPNKFRNDPTYRGAWMQEWEKEYFEDRAFRNAQRDFYVNNQVLPGQG